MKKKIKTPKRIFWIRHCPEYLWNITLSNISEGISKAYDKYLRILEKTFVKISGRTVGKTSGKRTEETSRGIPVAVSEEILWSFPG